MDDDGPVLPVCCHAGDLYSRWVRGHEADVRALLLDIAQAGYDGIRTWTCLRGSYWAGREVMADAATLGSFLAACQEYGLRVMLSQGDLWQSSVTTAQRRAVRDAILAVLPAHRETVLSIDAANEPVNNGGAEPDDLTTWLATIAVGYPDIVYTLGSPITEERTELDRYTEAPARVYDVHGYRDGSSTDRIRHTWNVGYESAPVRLGIQSEPTGPGERVTLGRESDANALQLMALAALCSRQWWVYFSGPGVVSDERERLQDMPGFREVPRICSVLPPDIMTWPTLVHGGARPGSPRVFAVPGTDETRADHTIATDGRYVCLMHGPRWRDCHQVRTASIETDIAFGNVGRLVMGRLA